MPSGTLKQGRNAEGAQGAGSNVSATCHSQPSQAVVREVHPAGGDGFESKEKGVSWKLDPQIKLRNMGKQKLLHVENPLAHGLNWNHTFKTHSIIWFPTVLVYFQSKRELKNNDHYLSNKTHPDLFFEPSNIKNTSLKVSDIYHTPSPKPLKNNSNRNQIKTAITFRALWGPTLVFIQECSK